MWKRLVWDVEQQPKLKVVASCAREQYDADEVGRALAPVKEKANNCRCCVDATFSKYWMNKLDGGNARRHYAALHEALAVLPICSCIVERKHPLGQEVQLSKKRGRSAKVQTLSTRTYRKSALAGNRKKVGMHFDTYSTR